VVPARPPAWAGVSGGVSGMGGEQFGVLGGVGGCVGRAYN
jgi:hypothetical protein